MPLEDYITTIGLEVHVQLKTQTKMFCGCEVSFGEETNTNTCPVCLGLPGALPVLNEQAIEDTILAGLSLGCGINSISKWDRKNYFYPDMPKDFQLTQFDLPLCINGGVPLYDYSYPKDAQKNISEPSKVVQLNRIHLEEDVAKSTHHAAYTSVDFNRAGTPLMEIVSEPDLDNAEQVVAYLNSLRQILLYSGVSDADMEKGQMRCDVNISLRPKGTEELGAKVELKNLNSISAIRRAVHHEEWRQAKELDEGIAQIQSTRRWDDDRGETSPMRTKEDAHDYRYFPEPDLLPVDTTELHEAAKKRVPELPHEKAERFQKEFKVSEYDASVLSSDYDLAVYFEEGTKTTTHAKKLANWIINNTLGELNERSLELAEFPVKSPQLAALVNLVEGDQVSGNQAKEVFSDMADTGRDPEVVAKEKGFEPMEDDGSLAEFCDQVIAENPDPVAEIKGGNAKAIGFLVGQVMKLSQGKANPKTVSGLLREKIG